jgi:hypothetical protein
MWIVSRAFIDCFTAKLAILVDEYGFSMCHYENTGLVERLRYTKKDLGLEFVFDIRDRAVDIYLIYLEKRGADKYRDIEREQAFISDFAQGDPEFEVWQSRWHRWWKKHRGLLKDEEYIEYICMKAEFYEWGLRKYGDSILRWAREQFGLPPEP